MRGLKYGGVTFSLTTGFVVTPLMVPNVRAIFGELADHSNTLLFGYSAFIFTTGVVGTIFTTFRTVALDWLQELLQLLQFQLQLQPQLQLQLFSCHVPFEGSTTWPIKSLSNCQLRQRNVVHSSHKALLRLRAELLCIFSVEESSLTKRFSSLILTNYS